MQDRSAGRPAAMPVGGRPLEAPYAARPPAGGRPERWWRRLGRIGRTAEIGVRFFTLAVIRWMALVGQTFTILVVHFSLGIELPLLWLVPALLLTLAVDVGVQVMGTPTARLGARQTFFLTLFDVLQLAFLLAVTGGVQNPFTVLMVLPVGLAAATLDRAPTAILTGVTLAALAVLAAIPTELPWLDGGLRLPPLYLFAAWLALSLTVVLVAVYVCQLASEARRHALALSALQLALAREQELSALGGQAAAAAHLLGTPLTTINVIAKELVRELPATSPLLEDANELLVQVLRCRETLAGLGSGQRDAAHAAFTRAPLSGLLATIAESCRVEPVTIDIGVDIEPGLEEPRVVLAPELRHSIANLIDNAVRFARARVAITVAVAHGGIAVEIADDGPGFKPEVLDWLGEPYLSTRREEGGLGLGVFIAKTLLARTGASMHFANRDKLSHPGEGAVVRIFWPSGALEMLGRESADDG